MPQCGSGTQRSRLAFLVKQLASKGYAHRWENFMNKHDISIRHVSRIVILVLLAGAVATCLEAAATAQQQADDTAALKNDIQQVKAQQQQILDRLDELKKLLNSRGGANAQPALKVPDTMSVEGELVRGQATA